MANYSYHKQLNLSFDDAVAKVIGAFQGEGFGVLTDIDVKKTLQEKIGVDFKNYRILGVCNPSKAHQALLTEEEVGLFLPCNVIVYEKDNAVMVAVINPEVVFSVIDNQALSPLVNDVGVILQRIINQLN